MSTNDSGTSGGAAVSISIVIPAYNEESRLMGSLDRIVAFMDAHHPDYEIVVVDDGSVDATAAHVRARMAGYPKLRLDGYSSNRGKGYAVRRGMLAAGGRVAGYLDADLAQPLTALPALLSAVAGGAEVAIGRLVRHETHATHVSSGDRRDHGCSRRATQHRIV